MVSEPDTKGATTTTVTNTHITRSVYAEKIWDDVKNQDGKRPKEIRLQLMADGVDVTPERIVTLDGNVDGNNVSDREVESWKAVWTGLPSAHPDGSKISYMVKELGSIPGYDSPAYNYEKEGTASDTAFTVTNTYKPETTSYTVQKTWLGDSGWTDDRPDSIMVQLYKKVGSSDPVVVGEEKELREDTGWMLIWEDLPKYENPTGEDTEVGHAYEIDYFVKELGVDGYTGEYDNGQLVNKLNTTELTVRKIWEDQDDHYKRRPSTIGIRLERRAGTDVNWVSVADIKGTLSMTENGEWNEVTFTGLPTYNKKNELYQYRAVEESMDDELLENNQALGYKAEHVHTPSRGVVPGTSVITNTLLPKEIRGTKIWEDQRNVYNTRPENIQLTLVSNPETGINGNQPETQPEWTKEGDTWTFIWKNLPKLAEDGTEIVYSVTEEVPTGYSATYGADGLTITNTLDYTSLKVMKTWADGEDFAGVRPGQIRVQVYQNDEKLVTTDGKEVFLELTKGENWTKEITDLPKYDAQGNLYRYKAVEIDTGRYTVTDVTNADEIGYTTEIVNTLIEEGDITVKKLWEDKSNQDGIRPEEIQVTLWKDKGVTGEEQSYTADLTEQTDWSHTWSHLPEFRSDGKTLCMYQLEEKVPDKYTLTGENLKVVSGGETVELSNAYVPKGMKIQVEKLWKGDAFDKTRPKSVTLKLISKVGEGTEEKEIVLPEIQYEQEISTPWKAEWSDLPVMYNKAGTETTHGSSVPIEYYVEEVNLDSRYAAILPTDSVSGDITDESNVGKNSHVLKVTNKLIATTTAKVKKEWQHKNNPFADEIKSVTFELQRTCNEPECTQSNWAPYEEEGTAVTVTINHQNGADGVGEKADL